MADIPKDIPEWFRPFADKLNLIPSIESAVKDIPSIQSTVKDNNHTLNELSNNVESVSSQLEKTIKELNIVKNDNVELKIAHDNLQLEVAKLKKDMLYFEANSKRCNLLFSGMKEPEDETKGQCELTLKAFLLEHYGQYLNEEISFETVFRLGKKQKDKARLMLAKFSNFKQRDLIWQKRFGLKDTHVWITEDFPQSVRENRDKLYPYFQAARRSPLITSTSLRLDKLFINNKMFTVENIDNIPEHLKPKNASIISTENTVVFASKDAILSNLYLCNIQIEGRVYNSTEQYIQYSKALLFNDQESADNILKEHDSFKQMKMGKKIRNFKKDTWKQRVHNVLWNANKAKFDQSLSAREVLLGTGTKTLGEATVDPYFGIGLRLTSKTVSDESKWTGDNIMGRVLTEIRSSFQ